MRITKIKAFARNIAKTHTNNGSDRGVHVGDDAVSDDEEDLEKRMEYWFLWYRESIPIIFEYLVK